MGFFAVWGVGFLNDIKKGFAYVYAFLTPCKEAFEKTTPCKGLFEKQSHAIPFFRLPL